MEQGPIHRGAVSHGKAEGQPGDIRGTGGKARNRLGFVRGAAARAGWRGGFGDAGMCRTWLAPGLAVARGRADGPAKVPGLPAVGRAFPVLQGSAHARAELYRPGRANKEAFRPEPLLCRPQQAQPVNALQNKGDFGLSFADGKGMSVCTNPALDPTVQRGWV